MPDIKNKALSLCCSKLLP